MLRILWVPTTLPWHRRICASSNGCSPRYAVPSSAIGLHGKLTSHIQIVPDRTTPASTLQVGGDPEGLMRNVQDKWVVTCAIALHKRTVTGDFTAASGMTFNVGDFVEVEAGVEVIVYRRHKPLKTPKTVDCRLRVTRVTRLLTGAAVVSVFNLHRA